ncbi:MAG TPA: hypothetical protein VGP63_29330 [Planctomycetaceae bacterium]|nr:hypothetical protein [Planctomycetaceae bacterium]
MAIPMLRTWFRLSTFASLVLLTLSVMGCTRTQSADQAIAKAYEAAGGTRQEVAKVAGTVTIDGQAPPDTGPFRTLIILYDPQKPESLKKAPIYAVCDEEGRFRFTTYGQGDGVPTGSYVALFAQLRMNTWGQMGYSSPDALKNEYNDPDRNEKIPEFKIDVAAPGKTDYQFDLQIAGKDGTSPGPRAITQIK